MGDLKINPIVKEFNKLNEKYELRRVLNTSTNNKGEEFYLTDKEGKFPPEIDVEEYGRKSHEVFEFAKEQFRKCFGKGEIKEYERYREPAKVMMWKYEGHILEMKCEATHPKLSNYELTITIL